MSVSAPPRCSLFVPVPRAEQLALVRRNYICKTLFRWSESIYCCFLPLFTYTPAFSPVPPFSFFLPLLPQRYFLVPAAKTCFAELEGEAWHSLWTVRSIKRAGLSLASVYRGARHASKQQHFAVLAARREIQPIRGTNKGPLTAEQGPKFIMRRVINSILWIASQCPHPGTIDDIQPTWLNPISKGDGWSWAHLHCNHIIAVWVNQTWIKRFVCSSWQTENCRVETMPHAESSCH